MRFDLLKESIGPKAKPLMISLVYAVAISAAMNQPSSVFASSTASKSDKPVNSAVSEPVERKKDRAFAQFQLGNYLSALNLALPRAEAGDAAAQTLIAEIYDRGLGVARDVKQAATWYEIAAKSGNREAQFAYSVKLMEGKVIEQNVELGIDMLRKAADAGHPTANFNYASYIISQRPTGAGYRQALPYFEKAAQYRLGDAFYSLSQIYKAGLTDGIQRPEIARNWLVRAAKAGIDTAQIDLALELIRGENGPKDEKQAFNWFLIAAVKGNVIAQNRLAHMYLNGVGTKQSSIEAAKWNILARRSGRIDPELDRFMQLLDEKTRNKAIAEASRWPSG